MARGFLGAIIKVSKAIDAANKRAAREAQKRHNQAIRMQRAAEKAYLLIELKKDEQRLKYSQIIEKQYQRENDKRFREQQALEKKLSKEEEMRRKEQFDKQVLKAKDQYAKRCEARETLRESYIRKILK